MQVQYRQTPDDLRTVAKTVRGPDRTSAWSVGIGLGSLVVPTLVVFFTRQWWGLIVPTLLVVALITWWHWKLRSCSEGSEEDVTLIITSDGLEQITPWHRSRASWTEFEVDAIPGFLVFRGRFDNFLQVPRRAFVSEDDMHRFADEARRFRHESPPNQTLGLGPLENELRRGTASVAFTFERRDLEQIPPLDSSIASRDSVQAPKKPTRAWPLIFFLAAVFCGVLLQLGKSKNSAFPLPQVGSFVVTGMVASLGAMGSLALLTGAAVRWQQRRAPQRLPDQPFTLTLTPTAMVMVSDRTQESRSWQGIVGISENAQLLTVWLTRTLVQVIPKRAFASQQDIDEFATQIRDYLAAAAATATPAPASENPYQPPRTQ